MRTITFNGGRIIHVQPSPRVRRLYWHLLGTGHDQVKAPTSVDAFALPGATILWVEAGRGEMRLESGTYLLAPGPSFLVFSTQQDRHYRPLGGKPYTVNTVRFGGPNIGAWLDELEVKKNPVFCVDPPDWIYRLKRELTRLATRQPLGWERRAHLMLSDALCRLLELRKPVTPQESELPPAVEKIFDAIAMNPDRGWKVLDLAALAGISYTRLRVLFNATMHESVHEFLQEHRLDRARILLAEGRLSVKEISGRLHFGNEYYFSTFFKTGTGYSPTQFRKHLGLK